MSKWAVVTGATAGIGESFTRILANDGFNIVLVARDVDRMKERAAHLESQFKVQTVTIQADLATDEGCAKVEKYLRENQIEVHIDARSSLCIGFYSGFDSLYECSNFVLDVLQSHQRIEL